MKKHERILERRKLFKQALLRPLAGTMYFEVKVREWKYKSRIPADRKEDSLLQKLTAASEAFHEFLQSHEFAHHEKLSGELMGKLETISRAARELGEFYGKMPEKPAELLDALPAGILRMRGEIEAFDAFEKRN